MKNYIHWLKLWFISTFLVLLVISIVNAIVDPYGYFSREDKYLANISRESKPNIIKTRIHSQGQYYIIGTSRQRRINPNWIELHTKQSTHNINISACTLEEEIFLVKKLKEVDKNFIVGLDPFSLNQTRIQTAKELELRYHSFQNTLNTEFYFFKEFLNYDLLFASIKHIGRMISKKPYDYKEQIENKTVFDINVNEIKNSFGKSSKGFYRNYTSYSDKVIINLAETASKEDIFVIYPQYALYYKMFQDHLNIEQQYFHSIATLTKHTKAQVWFFYQLNDITLEKNNFDTAGWHFKPKIGRIVYDKIYNHTDSSKYRNFGTLLTAKNVDKILENTSNSIHTYNIKLFK